jgi:hypothetical protein
VLIRKQAVLQRIKLLWKIDWKSPVEPIYHPVKVGVMNGSPLSSENNGFAITKR